MHYFFQTISSEELLILNTNLSAIGMWYKVTVGTIDLVGIELRSHRLLGISGLHWIHWINNFFWLLSALFRSRSGCCGGCCLLWLFGLLKKLYKYMILRKNFIYI